MIVSTHRRSSSLTLRVVRSASDGQGQRSPSRGASGALRYSHRVFGPADPRPVALVYEGQSGDHERMKYAIHLVRSP